MAVRSAIAAHREAATVPIDVPERDSTDNGAVERAIRTWQGMYRTIKIATERAVKRPLPILFPISE